MQLYLVLTLKPKFQYQNSDRKQLGTYIYTFPCSQSKKYMPTNTLLSLKSAFTTRTSSIILFWTFIPRQRIKFVVWRTASMWILNVYSIYSLNKIWKFYYEKLCGCCGDLWIVEISGGAVIACSFQLCVQVVNKSNLQSKTPVDNHFFMWHYLNKVCCVVGYGTDTFSVLHPPIGLAIVSIAARRLVNPLWFSCRYSFGLFFQLFLFGLWGYWHCGHSWPIVPDSGDSEDDCGEADGM
jgi:hypothetical protein